MRLLTAAVDQTQGSVSYATLAQQRAQKGRCCMATNRKDMPQHYFTLEEYFALEEASEARWEYWDGELVCMSGGSRKHIIISSNVFFRLQLQLGDGPCRAFTADLPVKTPTLPPYRYPDATVACG